MARQSFSAGLRGFGSWHALSKALRDLPPGQAGAVRKAVEELIHQVSNAGLSPRQALNQWIPDLLKAIPEEWLLQSLRAASALAQRKIDPGDIAPPVLVALCQASPSPEILRSNIDALENLIGGAERAGIDSEPIVTKGLLSAAQVLTPHELRIALSLSAQLAAHRIDPLPLLQRGLPDAAAKVAAPDFQAGLRLSSRLAEQGIDPLPTLETALAVLRGASPSDRDFSRSLAAYEGWLLGLSRAKLPMEPAKVQAIVSALAQDLESEQMSEAFSLGAHLAARGIDPAPALLQAVPALAAACFRPTKGTKQGRKGRAREEPESESAPSVSRRVVFREILGELERLAIALAQSPVDAGPTFEHGIPAAAAKLKPAQIAAALRAATELADSGSDPRSSLETGTPVLSESAIGSDEAPAAVAEPESIPAAGVQADVGLSEDLAEAVGKAAEQIQDGGPEKVMELASALAQRGIDPAPTVDGGLNAAIRALGSERADLVLRLAHLMAQKGIDPATVLQETLPKAVRSLNEGQLNLVLPLCERLASQGMDPGAALEALPSAASLLPDDFPDVIGLVEELVDAEIDPRSFLRYGLTSLLQLRAAGGDFGEQLAAMEELIYALQQGDVNPQRTLQVGLPEAARILSPSQFSAAMELAVKLAYADIDPCDMFRYAVPAAAQLGGSHETFLAHLAAIEELQMSLASCTADPRRVLKYGLGAAAQALSADEFQRGLAAAAHLASRGVDPSRLLEHALPALARAFWRERYRPEAPPDISPDPQAPSAARVSQSGLHTVASREEYLELFESNLEAVEELVSTLSDDEADAESCLEAGIPAAVEASRTRIEFRENLAPLRAFAAAVQSLSIDSRFAFDFGLPPVAELSRGPREFGENLKALEGLLAHLDEAPFDAPAFLQFGVANLPAAGQSAGSFRANLEHLQRFVAVLTQRGVADTHLVRYGLTAAVHSSPGPDALGRTLEAMADLSAALANGGVESQRVFEYGVTIASRRLAPARFSASLRTAAELAREGTDPRFFLEFGAEAVAAACPSENDYLSGLQAARELATRLTRIDIDLQPVFEFGLPAAAQLASDRAALTANIWLALELGMPALTSTETSLEFSAALEVLEGVVLGLKGEGINPATPPGLEELTRKALGLRESGQDFRIVVRSKWSRKRGVTAAAQGPAGARGEESPPPDRGRTERIRTCDVEPVGRPAPGAAPRRLTNREAEANLERRSWLWRTQEGQDVRSRARERIQLVSRKLPQLLAGLSSAGQIAPATEVAAVYVFGSFPWVEAPGNLDLMVLAEGRRELSLVDLEAGQDRLVQLNGNEIPVRVHLVGAVTLMKAGEGEVSEDEERLVKYNALLYQAILLSGRDVTRAAEAPWSQLRAWRQRLLQELEEGNESGGAGAEDRLEDKRGWRQMEIAALDFGLRQQKRRQAPTTGG